MLSRLLAAALLTTVTISAAPPPKAIAAPKTIAPPTVPHPMAMYLCGLSKDGKEKVTIRARALGTHFFLEEPTGVTVYNYDEKVGYKKEMFLKGYTLAKAMKKYK